MFFIKKKSVNNTKINNVDNIDYKKIKEEYLDIIKKGKNLKDIKYKIEQNFKEFSTGLNFIINKKKLNNPKGTIYAVEEMRKYILNKKIEDNLYVSYNRNNKFIFDIVLYQINKLEKKIGEFGLKNILAKSINALTEKEMSFNKIKKDLNNMSFLLKKDLNNFAKIIFFYYYSLYTINSLEGIIREIKGKKELESFFKKRGMLEDIIIDDNISGEDDNHYGIDLIIYKRNNKDMKMYPNIGIQIKSFIYYNNLIKSKVKNIQNNVFFSFNKIQNSQKDNPFFKKDLIFMFIDVYDDKESKIMSLKDYNKNGKMILHTTDKILKFYSS